MVSASVIVKLSSVSISAGVEASEVTVRTQLLGDIDGNETVDVDDCLALFQYSMLPDLYPIDYVGSVDFDKNGTVDVDDCLRLFQYSILPDLYPLV